MSDLVLIEGAFGHLELLDNETKLKKTYLEDRKKLNIPRLVSASDKIYKVFHPTEHETHTILSKALPNIIPKIYSYKEIKYTDIPETDRPPIPEILIHQKAKINDLYSCEVIMDFIKYPNMSTVVFSQLYDNRNNAVQLVKLWFKNILDMIRIAHVIPADFHTGNILCDLPKNIYFIDYAYYDYFTLVANVDDSLIDYGIKIDIKTGQLTKTKLNTSNELITEPITDTKDFEISQYDAEMLLIPNLIKDMNRNIFKCVQQVIWSMFVNEFIGIYKQAMNELKISSKLQDIVISLLTRPAMVQSIQNSLTNWMNGGSSSNSPSHSILTYMMIHPVEFAHLQNKWDPILDITIDIHKMNGDELKAYIDSIKDKITKIERHYIWLKWHNFGAKKEFINMRTYAIQHLQPMKELFRAEFTNRFNSIKVGDTIKWDNLIVGSPRKEFCSIYFDNIVNNCVEPPADNARNYLFNFTNVKAAQIKNLESDKSVYSLYCNSKNPDDTNWLNANIPNRILIGAGEYMIEPFHEYKVKNITNGLKTKHIYENKEYEHNYTLIELQ